MIGAEGTRPQPDFRSACLGLLRGVDTLPSLPPLLWELQAALMSARTDASEIAFIIEKDPGLAGTVLRIANSSWYGSTGHVMDLRQAVARLGTRVLQQVATSALMIDALRNFGSGQAPEQFWKHSIRVAFICRTLCDTHPKRTPLISEAAYTAGLLHDIGKLALEEYFSAECATVHEWKEARGCSHAEAERAVLGIDHGEVGAVLLDLWNLPDELVNGVQYHHSTDDANPNRRGTPALICAADAVAHAIEDGNAKECNNAAGDFCLSGDAAVQLHDELQREEDLVSLMIAH